MKVIHLSDIHIGVENYGKPTTLADLENLPEYFAPGVDRENYLGISTRLLDFLETFDAVIHYIKENDVDLVLFAGDAYKSRDPNQTHQREFARRIAQISDLGVNVFLTVGNHDIPHISSKASALEIFPTLQVKNITIGDTLKTYRIVTKTGPVQIVALPWIRISQFMAREETRNLPLDQIIAQVEARLADILAAEASALDPSIPAFLCGHITAAGATLSSERSMMLGNDHMLSLGTLANPAFDYVALGHIHKHQILTQQPLVVYPGSLQRIDFSEENDVKGFCAFDVDFNKSRGNRIDNFAFVPVNARPMLTIPVLVEPGFNSTEVTLSEISTYSKALLATAIVRLRVTMNSEDESTFNESQVRDALKEAYFIAGVERRINRGARTRLGSESAESLSPLGALEVYFQSRNVPEQRQKQLLEYAEDIIRKQMDQ